MAQQIVELHRERQEIVAGQRLLVAQTAERGRESLGAFAHRRQRHTLGARVDAANQLEDQYQLLAEGLRLARGQLHDGAELSGLLARLGQESLEPAGVDVHDFLEHFAQTRIRRVDDGGWIERGRGGLRGFLHGVRRRDRGREMLLFTAEAAHRHRDRIGRGHVARQRDRQRCDPLSFVGTGGLVETVGLVGAGFVGIGFVGIGSGRVGFDPRELCHGGHDRIAHHGQRRQGIFGDVERPELEFTGRHRRKRRRTFGRGGGRVG